MPKTFSFCSARPIQAVILDLLHVEIDRTLARRLVHRANPASSG